MSEPFSLPPRQAHPWDRNCPGLNEARGCIWCCDRCNYDRHTCPGCGDNLPHNVSVCDDCAKL